MKLGGLFSGVGGFELAWTQLGHEVAWMCEWDAKARKVLEARFPGIPIYPDVRDLDPAEVEAVDVLTGGSPCQGFSVAGARTGLKHSESQLFADYIRIMDGLAERGLKYALWENVPGVLSITNEDGERTFNHVVAALAGGTEPVRLPADKRWNTGLAAGRGRAVAWRVLDSRYFGVAQRRRRVFACVAFGDSCEDRAGRALLAVAEGVRGDSSASVEAGEAASRSADESVGGSRIPELAGAIGAQQRGGQDLDGTTYLPDLPAGFRMTAFGQYQDDDSALTLKQRDHKDATDPILSPAFGMYGNSGQEGATVEEQPAITASHGQPGNVAQAFNWQSGGDARGLDLTDQPSALTTQQTPAVLLTMREEEQLTLATGKGQTLNVFDVGDTRTTHAIVEPKAFDGYNQTLSDTAQTIRADKSDGDHVGMVLDPTLTALEPTAFTQNQREEVRNLGDQTAALSANTGMHQTNYISHYGVRRLTPVECERLQSFPDGWTEPSGSDSARYKAMGNAVTVNVVRWILGRLP